MKLIKIVFLFLFIGLWSKTQACFAQQAGSQVDSLSYYYQLAIQPNKPDDFTKAYDYFSRHKETCLQQNNTQGAIYDLRLLSIILFESGFYNDSENVVVEGLKLLEGSDDSAYTINSQIGFYNQLGRIRQALKEFDTSISYFEKALELTDNLSEKASILNNLGLVYRDNNDLDSAKMLFSEAYETALTSRNSAKIATTLDNLGFVNFKLDDPSALEEMQKALDMRLSNELFYKTFPSYSHLSDYYLKQGDTVKAKAYLIKAKEVSEAMNSESYKIEVLKKLLLLDSNSVGSAYANLNEDKLARQQTLENTFAARKYNYEQQQEIALKNKRQKQLAILAVLVLSVIGTLFFIIIKIRHKRAKLREVYDTEFKLSKRIHDEVSNDIYQVMAQLESGQNDELAIDLLDDVYSKTRDISRENRLISKDENFEETLKELITNYKTEATKIITKGLGSVNLEKLDLIKKITLFRVIQELLTNMRKHSKADLVAIIFEKHNKTTIIKYSDNGVGADLKSLNGLKNTENRMEAIGGKITFETQPGNGFKASLSIK